MGKTDSTMETRTQSRLDAQEETIRNLTGQLQILQQNQERHYSTLQENQEKLQGLLLQWMKRTDKQPMVDDAGDSPDQSTVHPHPSLPTHVAPAESSPAFNRIPPLHDFSHLTTKFKLPPFSGDDPRGWLTRAETYFDIHGIPENHRIPLAHICMEGVAVHWFSMVRELQHNLSWDGFRTELLNRFGGVANLSPYEQLAALRQSGTIDEYIDAFEMLAAMVPRETEALYLGYFMNGLRDEIKHWVRLLAPESRLRAFHVARNVEIAIGGKGGAAYTSQLRAPGASIEGGHVRTHSSFKNTGLQKMPQVG